jgi:hypothetical protein
MGNDLLKKMFPAFLSIMGPGGLIALVGIMALVFLFVGAAYALALMASYNGGGSGSGDIINGACGTGKLSLMDNYEMLYPGQSTAKLGHEEHLTNTNPSHFEGTDSNPLTFAGGGAFSPHTTDQEHWYINSLWGGWDWSTTSQAYRDSHGGHTKSPVALTTKEGKEARAKVAHAKLIIVSKETGKSLVASAEESGPALYVGERDGVYYGAPPEVYRYLGTSDPYTGKPKDGKGEITVNFAEDQGVALGPCK